MSTAADQLYIPDDIPGYLRGVYSVSRTPHVSVEGKRLSHAQRGIEAVYMTFSDQDEGRRCRVSYRKLNEDYGYSTATVAKANEVLEAAGLIERDRSGRDCATYLYLGEVDQSKFYKVYKLFYKIKARRKSEIKLRDLTNVEVRVLALIVALTRKYGVYNGSYQTIANLICAACSSVQSAIDFLLKSGLIYRTKKGTNGSDRSEYTVNSKLRRALDKLDKKGKDEHTEGNVGEPSKKKPEQRNLTKKEIATLNEKTEFESYYAKLQWKAKQIAEAYESRLDSDVIYKDLHTQLKKLEIDLAKAEVFYPGAVTELKTKKQMLRVRISKRMAELNISPKDLKPPWQCKKCSDSGFLPNGRQCSCYPKKRR